MLICMVKRAIALCLTVVPCSLVFAQFSFDFEAYNADAAGIVLSGQDGWFNPVPASSDEFRAYTYAGNDLGIGANPFGGSKMIAGVKLNPGFFVRAQRNVDFAGGPDVAVIAFDQYISYAFDDRNNNQNIGSVSGQPANQKQFIILTTWVTPRSIDGAGDGRPEDGWEAAFSLFDPDGIASVWSYLGTDLDGDGDIDESPFSGLAINKWYRRYAVIDFVNNRVIKHGIMDRDTGEMFSHNIGVGPEWDNLHGQFVYVSGGINSAQPRPSAIRFFTGGGTGADNGNLTAYDNLMMYAHVSGDVNMDGCVDDADLLNVLFGFGEGTGDGRTTFHPADLNGDGNVDDADLLLVLFGFGNGC